VFPPALVEPCIKAGTSERGCCPECGAPWERVVEKTGTTTTEKTRQRGHSDKRGDGGALVTQNLDYAGGHGDNLRPVVTLGFRPTCQCSGLAIIGDQPSKPAQGKRSGIEYAADLALWKARLNSWWLHWEDLKPLYEAEPKTPCLILDPFAGRGTTAKVARDLGRDCVLVDRSHQYLVENATTYLELDKLKAWGQGGIPQDSNLEGLPMFKELS